MKTAILKVSIYSFTIEAASIADAIQQAKDRYNSMGMITSGYLTTWDGQQFRIQG